MKGFSFSFHQCEVTFSLFFPLLSPSFVKEYVAYHLTRSFNIFNDTPRQSESKRCLLARISHFKRNSENDRMPIFISEHFSTGIDDVEIMRGNIFSTRSGGAQNYRIR